MTDQSGSAAPYQPDPLLPAAPGWCEAITHAGEHCYAKAKFDRDGQRVCGLHLRADHLVTQLRGL